MINKFREENGFTLADTMISVVIFIIVCVFIVQSVVYVFANNKRGDEIYKASMLASSAIEEFKSLNSPFDFFDSDFVKGSDLNILNDFTEFEQTIIINKYYDKDFKNVDFFSEDVTYVQEFLIYVPTFVQGFTYVKNEENLDVSGMMFNIRTSVVGVENGTSQNQLVNYSAKKYFSNWGLDYD